MARRVPKSFFWIDQKLIRGGLWLKLSRRGKLLYVALSAACDREGRCHWGREKLMDLAGEQDFEGGMEELAAHHLIEVHDGVVELLSLEEETGFFRNTPAKPTGEARGAVVVTVQVATHVTP